MNASVAAAKHLVWLGEHGYVEGLAGSLVFV
jgi:hypothetical protein